MIKQSLIRFKSLREYAYDLVEYDTSDKNNRNKAFEMIVLRGPIECAFDVCKQSWLYSNFRWCVSC